MGAGAGPRYRARVLVSSRVSQKTIQAIAGRGIDVYRFATQTDYNNKLVTTTNSILNAKLIAKGANTTATPSSRRGASRLIDVRQSPLRGKAAAFGDYVRTEWVDGKRRVHPDKPEEMARVVGDKLKALSHGPLNRGRYLPQSWKDLIQHPTILQTKTGRAFLLDFIRDGRSRGLAVTDVIIQKVLTQPGFADVVGAKKILRAALAAHFADDSNYIKQDAIIELARVPAIRQAFPNEVSKALDRSLGRNFISPSVKNTIKSFRGIVSSTMYERLSRHL